MRSINLILIQNILKASSLVALIAPLKGTVLQFYNVRSFAATVEILLLCLRENYFRKFNLQIKVVFVLEQDLLVNYRDLRFFCRCYM